MNCPVTYKQTVPYVKENYGQTIHTYVIATVLRALEYEVRKLPDSDLAKNPQKPTNRAGKAIYEAKNKFELMMRFYNGI